MNENDGLSRPYPLPNSKEEYELSNTSSTFNDYDDSNGYASSNNSSNCFNRFNNQESTDLSSIDETSASHSLYSCGYPTDEQTQSLNTLNSFHRGMMVGRQRGCCVDADEFFDGNVNGTAHGSAVASSKGSNREVDFKEDSSSGNNSSQTLNDAMTNEELLLQSSRRPTPGNPPQCKRSMTTVSKLNNRLHILQMARKRLAESVASKKMLKNACGAGGEGAVDDTVVEAQKKIVVPPRVSNQSVPSKHQDGEEPMVLQTSSSDDTGFNSFLHFLGDVNAVSEEESIPHDDGAGDVVEEGSFLDEAVLVDQMTVKPSHHLMHERNLNLPQRRYDNTNVSNEDDDTCVSNYNINASTLSLSTMETNPYAGVRSFLGVGGDIGGNPTCAEAILRQSNGVVEKVHDDVVQQPTPTRAYKTTRHSTDDALSSAETYSYTQAYNDSDNITDNHSFQDNASTAGGISTNEGYSFCPSSKHSSAFSALTDEYCYDVSRRTGAGYGIDSVADDNDSGSGARGLVRGGKGAQDSPEENQRTHSGPVDVDTNAIRPTSMRDEGSYSYDSSLARPPPPPTQVSNDCMYGYGDEQHLATIIRHPSDAADGLVAIGGAGYVDEEAAMRYASLRREQSTSAKILSCNWITSSSRFVKFLLLIALGLMLLSVACVSFGVLLKNNDENVVESAVARPAVSKGDESGVNTGNGGTVGMEGGPQGNNNDGLNQNEGDSAIGFFPSYPTPSPSYQPTAELTTITDSRGEDPFVPAVPAPTPVINIATSPPTFDAVVFVPAVEVSFPPITSSPTYKPATPIPSPFPTTSMADTMEPTGPVYASQLQSQTVHIKAAYDTYINSALPNSNFGTFSHIDVDGQPASVAVIAFDLSAIIITAQVKQGYDPSQENQHRRTAQTVTEATLRLYATDGSSSGGGVIYALPNAWRWEETDLTWNSASENVDQLGATRVGSIDEIVYQDVWYEVDVTAAFTNGLASMLHLMIQSESSDGVSFASREGNSGNYAPELVLTVSSDGILGDLRPSDESTWPTYVPTTATDAPSKATPNPSRMPSRRPTSKVSLQEYIV